LTRGVALLDLQAQELGTISQNALAEAEAKGEVGEVGRRCHHDDVGDAVIGEGDRHLGRNCTVPRDDGTVPKAEAGDYF
jgi:hypothetical protein